MEKSYFSIALCIIDDSITDVFEFKSWQNCRQVRFPQLATIVHEIIETNSTFHVNRKVRKSMEYDCHIFSKHLVFQMKNLVFQSKYQVF